MVARRVTVHGRVQGVFFRASTRDRARELAVGGWVRNEPDGTVTAHLEGPDDAVNRLLDWIRDGGPGDAVVTHVDVDDVEPRGEGDFHVR